MSGMNEREKNTDSEVKQRSLIRQIIIIIGAGLILYTACLIIGVNKASEIGFDRYFQTLLGERIDFFQKEITKRTDRLYNAAVHISASSEFEEAFEEENLSYVKEALTDIRSAYDVSAVYLLDRIGNIVYSSDLTVTKSDLFKNTEAFKRAKTNTPFSCIMVLEDRVSAVSFCEIEIEDYFSGFCVIEENLKSKTIFQAFVL